MASSFSEELRRNDMGRRRGATDDLRLIAAYIAYAVGHGMTAMDVLERARDFLAHKGQWGQHCDIRGEDNEVASAGAENVRSCSLVGALYHCSVREHPAVKDIVRNPNHIVRKRLRCWPKNVRRAQFRMWHLNDYNRAGWLSANQKARDKEQSKLFHERLTRWCFAYQEAKEAGKQLPDRPAATGLANRSDLNYKVIYGRLALACRLETRQRTPAPAPAKDPDCLPDIMRPQEFAI